MSDRARPDIELGATVKMGKLRFGRRPAAEAHMTAGDAESVVERENLPDEIEPGVTYRDAGVRVRVSGRLVEDRPLAES